MIRFPRGTGVNSPSASGNILGASPAILSAAPSIPDTPLTSLAARLDALPSGSRSASASAVWYGAKGEATSSRASRTDPMSSDGDAPSPADGSFLPPPGAGAEPGSIRSYARERKRSVASYAAATAAVPPPSTGLALSPRPGTGQRFPSLFPNEATMGRKVSIMTRTTMDGARSGPNTCRLCCLSAARRSRTDS